jgi:rsbT co-antagonist protein RsbR
MTTHHPIAVLLADRRGEVLDGWLTTQADSPTVRAGLMSDTELRQDAERLLDAIARGLTQDPDAELNRPAWDGVRDVLDELSRSRVASGFTPSETATFVFSLKQPLFDLLRTQEGDVAEALWAATTVVDGLGLLTVEAYQRTREEIIRRQQEELLELSTPVVKVWDGAVALPLIGALDSARTQVVMESLLERILETDSTIAIIDITGVPTVDTLVAQHLLKTVSAARLMGADCIISGIRPQIAQTIVQLGLDLTSVTTKATMADALAEALTRTGYRMVPVDGVER